MKVHYRARFGDHQTLIVLELEVEFPSKKSDTFGETMQKKFQVPDRGIL